MKSPLILVSPNRFGAEDRHFYKHKELEYGDASMANMIRAAGGLPVMAYRAGASEGTASEAHARALVSRCEGLLMTGGIDISPGCYGEEARDEAWCGDPVRDAWELALLQAAEEAGLPILGICRGHQLLNVHRGGSLYQDIQSTKPDSLQHRSQEDYCQLFHPVELQGTSRLTPFFEEQPLVVNSVHHQAVCVLGRNLRVVASAPDGIVEAIEDTTGRWVLGVQWHPEWMQDSVVTKRIFDAFIEEARSS